MWPFSKIPSVTLSEVEPKARIIDVREPYEFKQRHLPKAVNVPLSRVQNYETQGRVYVICASGARSRRAVKILRKKGIDAVDIRGGMMANARG